MQYISTRGQCPPVDFATAIQSGLAPDGGLYIPETFPQVQIEDLMGLSYTDLAQRLLQPFLNGSCLSDDCLAICERAFNFPAPVTQLNANTQLLELFHGPTLAFKDFGARFLAECMNRLATQQKMTLMIATSGDTGSAVASAFHGQSHMQVVILYPQGKVSDRQEQQITCWGDNVLALSVAGTFDDCQHLVKSAFNSPDWQNVTQLSTANSINIARLLPQMTYYAFSSLQHYQQHQQAARFIVPSGNLGNVTAAYWAKHMGLPIDDIVIATNANAVVSDYLQTGEFKPRASVKTLANAMDVGSPSNFERLQVLFPDFAQFKAQVKAVAVNDAQIKATLTETFVETGTIICPHTATACFVRNQCDAKPWIVVATAHASKFADIIEPMINTPIPVPEALQALLDKDRHFVAIPAQADQVFAQAQHYFSL